ncbi:hypothetical protein A2V71_01785 [Candidatus Berkelbacteria bacterium RBG_13_40_8]|uniref:Acyl-protein synthetase LuxE domain-containing protein n=1 Tax=Candidatus Berkelbacteria bacterium RBG_13_40_8 TaxID=1797467 RepID=A0A1F5DQ14_9BACT|nr:MAG: hypothetical protein A2V71_01785 [Candidatus Berkelbacteria bacterium RBG_13_40_8]
MEKTLSEIDSKILAIIKEYGYGSRRTTTNFESLAIEVFRFQFNFNRSYREYCTKMGVEVNEVKTLNQIPVVSVNAYKDGTISSTVPEIDQGYYYATSGTSTGASGRIYRDPGFFELREEAIRTAGKKEMFFRFFPRKVPIVFLDFPNRRHSSNFQPHFSVLSNIQKFFGSELSHFIDIKSIDGLETFVELIKESQQENQKSVILGPSYKLSFLLSTLGEQHDLRLPIGSMVMDSGGLKRQSCHKSYAEYVDNLLITFGIDRYDYINTYALSEIGSQFSDNVRLRKSTICKQCPPWAKVRVVEKTACGETDCSPGEKGEVIIYDLLNRGSILALQTHDLAVKTETGFQILERGE